MTKYHRQKCEFELSQTQLQRILFASKPIPLIALQCGMPVSHQDRANAIWKSLGEEMGFAYMTVEPSSKGDRFFLAEPSKK